MSFECLPFLSKKDVKQNYKDFIVKTYDTIVCETSGSSGIPMRIYWDRKEYYRSISYLWRYRAKYQIWPNDLFLTCHSHFTKKGSMISNPIILSGSSLSFSKLWYSEERMKQLKRSLERFSPKWVLAQPSFVYHIGKYLKTENPLLLEQIKYIELTGEMLSDSVRHEIQRLFPNARVANMYGLQEFNGVLYEANDGMEIINKNAYVEIVRDDGSKCNHGEEGEIVITGLVNSTFPLIRYRTGDRGRVFCVGDMLRYEITSGRSLDSFLYNEKQYDGSLFFTVVDLFNKEYNYDIAKFQVVLVDDTLRFNVYSYDRLPNPVFLANAFRKILLDLDQIDLPVVVTIQTGEEFIIDSKKVKYFINMQKGV